MKALLLLTVAAGFAVMGACQPGQTSVSTIPVGSGPPECPHTWHTKRDSILPVPSATEWPTLNVPEFNDCQRFIEVDRTGQRHYTDGYFAIFAFRDSTPLDVRMGNRQGVGLPVAFIYADSQPYPQLGINKGGNCLYLYRAEGHWAGFVRPAVVERRGKVNCEKSLDAPRAGTGQLVVAATQVPGLEQGDYPNTARWDWDPQSEQQYMGVPCGRAWCEVGASGLTTSHAHPERAKVTWQRERRTVLVKGWYDEQYLARCGGTPPTCRPTALVGTIFPDPQLDSTKTADYKGRWIPVARVAIAVDPNSPDATSSSADLLAYKTKFNFQLTPQNSQLNEIDLCHGDAATCHVVPPTAGCPSATEETEHGLWWVKITAAQDASERYRCIVRRPTTAAVHVIGAVRWRWLLADETNWIRCDEGCCEVQGGA